MKLLILKYLEVLEKMQVTPTVLVYFIINNVDQVHYYIITGQYIFQQIMLLIN